MTATRIRTDPLAAPRANATANAAGRTPGTSAPGPRKKAPTTRTDAALARAAATRAATRPAATRAAARPGPAVPRPAPATARRAVTRPAVGAGAPTAAAATARPLPLIAPSPRTQPARRTPLRIVSPPDPEAKARHRRRLWVGLLAGLACAGLFAIVGVRVLLAQGQAPVDRLESQVTAAQAENQRLRFDVARLESPSRIVAEAQSRLGMVPPSTVVYLTPAATQTQTPAG